MNDEAKLFATTARRRDERELIRDELRLWTADRGERGDMDAASPD